MTSRVTTNAASYLHNSSTGLQFVCCHTRVFVPTCRVKSDPVVSLLTRVQETTSSAAWGGVHHLLYVMLHFLRRGNGR